MAIRFEFKREDCWIGVYWRTVADHCEPTGLYRAARGEQLYDWHLQRDTWICLVPMLPLHITQTWTERR